jgi:hypothetical protein
MQFLDRLVLTVSYQIFAVCVMHGLRLFVELVLQESPEPFEALGEHIAFDKSHALTFHKTNRRAFHKP